MARHGGLVKGTHVSVVIAIGVVVAALYVAQEVLIPLALAILLSFLLAPIVSLLERWRLGRVFSVLATVTIAFVVIAAIAWIVGRQIISLAEALPQYQGEIERKAHVLRSDSSGLGQKIQHVANEVEKATIAPSTRPVAATQPAEQRVMGPLVSGSHPGLSPVIPGSSRDNPLYMIAIPESASPIKVIGSYLGLVLNPLATAGLVVVFVVFMLLEREDLRDRMIRLISRGRYTVTTRALNDAATRISRYLLAQSRVNGSYGLAVGLGLCLVGLIFGHGTLFPSFFLWGLLSAVLRFIPYVGAFIAAAFPIALSLAVYPGFSVFIATAALLVMIELITSNVLEPWLYGASTGISTIALLVAAVFWTWLWGPIGLLLSTPLTVCIAVLGKHVPQLKFFDVLLGDQPALPPAVSYYQRLLAGDQQEAAKLALDVAREQGAEKVPDEVLIPSLIRGRRDRQNNDLSPEKESLVLDETSRIVQQVAAIGLKGEQPPPASDAPLVLGCPAHHRSEEIVCEMLEAVLQPAGVRVEHASTRLLPADIETMVERDRPAVLFIAVLPPGGLVQARYLCRRLRRKFPELPIVVGYWGRARNFDALLVKLRAAGASYVNTSMQQTRSQIAALLKLPAPAAPPAASPASGAVIAGAVS